MNGVLYLGLMGSWLIAAAAAAAVVVVVVVVVVVTIINLLAQKTGNREKIIMRL